jgi:histidine triad (HIT) family protein
MAAAYDTSNVFARILRGDIPATRVYEDDRVVVVMDVMPQATGHTLVLPKAPARNLLDADPAVLAPMMVVAQRVARASMKAFGADGVMIMQFNEPAAGQTVFHLHVHVVPRFEGVPLQRHAGGKMEEKAVLAANAEKLKVALAGG